MRITIVGHGPSIENIGLGSFIDDTDGYVVRISRSHLSWNPLHHGNRTDYVCTAIRGSKHILRGPKPLYETWMYFPKSSNNEQKSSGWTDKLQVEGFNPVICSKEIKPWLLRYKELNSEWKRTYFKRGDRKIYSYFSTGMAAIIIAMQRIEHVNELLLIGFDNLTKGSRDNFVSLSRKRKPLHSSGHNYAVEQQLLDEVVFKLGVKLIIK